MVDQSVRMRQVFAHNMRIAVRERRAQYTSAYESETVIATIYRQFKILIEAALLDGLQYR